MGTLIYLILSLILIYWLLIVGIIKQDPILTTLSGVIAWATLNVKFFFLN